MKKWKMSTRAWVILSVFLMLISMFGASYVQQAGGKVQVKDISFETSAGYEISALLLKPKGVSAENKAPAVIVCHGMYNNKEMQDANYVELSRRGFVVLAIDMFSHGDSEKLTTDEMLPMGVTEALKMVSTLSYVDTERIGLTGHSMGGMNCNIATLTDVAQSTNLVSALLLNSCFATYADEKTKEYTNVYGGKDVGIIAGQYDEFLFRETDKNGKMHLPKDFIQSENAQSFLRFGKDPEGKDVRKGNVMYRQSVEGEEAVRVIYNPAVTHPWSHFSKQSTKATIEFFDETLGSPNEIASGKQIWQVKEMFNFLGIVGFGIFVLSFSLLLLKRSEFKMLNRQESEQTIVFTKQMKIWMWVTLVGSIIFGTVTYLPVAVALQADASKKIFFTQNTTFAIAVWAGLCGVFIFLGLWIFYKKFHKAENKVFKERGFRMSAYNCLKTVEMAILVVGTAYIWVIFADYFFKTDFRLWILAVKTVDAPTFIAGIIPNAFLFTLYFTAVIIVGSYIGQSNEKKGRVNTIFTVLFPAIPAVVLIVVQYVHLGLTGDVFFSSNNTHSMILWLFPMVVCIPVSVWIGKKLYEKTNNPYLPGIITGIIVALISCASTSTWV